MTLIIEKPTTSRLILAKDYVGIDDPDAAVYIAAVEAADEAASPGVGALETATKVAIHSFVKGCKNDGIWPAIKASCILAGARTLAGALVPLVGTAPTNVGPFVSGDYNRLRLKGNGTTKYLSINYGFSSSMTNNNHATAWVNEYTSLNVDVDGLFSNTPGGQSGETLMAAIGNVFRSCSSGGISVSTGGNTGLFGVARTVSTTQETVRGTTFRSDAVGSQATVTANFSVFAMPNFAVDRVGNWGISFYSFGEYLNLGTLRSRVTTLMNAFAAAIP